MANSRRPPITHVAIRYNGTIYSLPAPNRHHDVLRHIIEVTGEQTIDVGDDDEGFLDAGGRYLRRPAAMVSAKLNNQIKPDAKLHGSILTSEDIW